MSTELAMDLPGAKAEPATPTRSKHLPWLITGVLLLAAAGWAVHRYTWYLHHVTTDNAQLDGHITIIAPKVQAFVSRVLEGPKVWVIGVGDSILVNA